MTLILTHCSRHHVLQVSDRFVTWPDGSLYDRLANKTVVLFARDGVAVLSYTGLAFVGDIPTDQWMVEQLTGEQFERGRNPPALGPGHASLNESLGRLLQQLANSLSDAVRQVHPQLREAWTRQHFCICFSGWQWKQRRYRPVIGSIGKARDETQFSLQFFDRYWFADGRFTFASIPRGQLPPEQIERLRSTLPTLSIDDAEKLLIDVIQIVSKDKSSVGPDCLSVLISPPIYGQLQIRYSPRSAERALLEFEKGTIVVPVAFSPWVIGPGVTMGPSLRSGSGWGSRIGFYRVEFLAPEAKFPDGGWEGFGFMGSQDRTHPPQR